MAEVAGEEMEEYILGIKTDPVDEDESIFIMKEEVKQELEDFVVEDGDLLIQNSPNFGTSNIKKEEDTNIEKSDSEIGINLFFINQVNQNPYLNQVRSPSLDHQNLSTNKNLENSKTSNKNFTTSEKISKNKELGNTHISYLKVASKNFKQHSNEKIYNDLIARISSKADQLTETISRKGKCAKDEKTLKLAAASASSRKLEKYIGINKSPCKEYLAKKCGLKFHLLTTVIDQSNTKTLHQVKISNNKAKIYNTPKKPFACNICDKSFQVKRYLDRHMTIHSNDKRYDCNLCVKTFREKVSLNKHMKFHSENPFCCDFCVKVFKEMDLLKTHTLSHESGRLFKCPACDSFPVVKKNHNDIALLTSNEEIYRCSNCNEYLKEKPTNNQTFSNSKLSFTCNLCELSFDKKISLCTHVLSTHFKEFTCNVCYESFNAQGEFKHHTFEVHEKMVETYNEKNFKDKETMESQIGINFTTKKYSSEICKIKNSNELRNIRGVTNGLQTCGICGQMFSEVRFLRRHEKQRHDCRVLDLTW